MNQAGNELDAAQKHFVLGTDFFRTEKWDAARVEFQAAYDLSHHSDLLHNLSLTAERQGKLADAIAFEEQFVREKETDRDSPLTEREQDEARGRIARLRDSLRRSQDAPHASPPPPGLASPAPEAARPTVGSASSLPWPAVGLLSLGTAALVSGIACGGLALADQNRLYSGVFLDEYTALQDRGPKLNAAAIGLSLVGGLAIAGGGAWWLVSRFRRSP